jgi:gluconate 2-dehydrogenase gamma chain
MAGEPSDRDDDDQALRDQRARLYAIGINRRQAIVRLAAASGVAVAPALAGAQPAAVMPVAPDPRPPAPVAMPATTPTPASGGEAPLPPKGSRDPADPDLVNPQLLWERLLTPQELETVAAVCDVILPADDRSPAASKVGVHEFVDEWVSAPYPRQKDDRQIVRGGLAWLNTESNRRFGRPFSKLGEPQKTAICDDICDEERARARPAGRSSLQAGALFFARMRWLTMLGFYTTLEGMKDIGYVGNMPSAEWKGPPDAILRRLKLVI